jgi:hypothetical protein
LTDEDKNTIVNNVKKFLLETEKASCKVVKAQISLRLFSYLSEPKCCQFMKDHQRFGTTVLNKLKELKSDFKTLPKYQVQYEMLSEKIYRRMKRNGRFQ